VSSLLISDNLSTLAAVIHY